MEGIAIFIYDYSALGGAQKVTSNLVNLFLKSGFPIKCVISIKNSQEMDYNYRIPIEMIGSSTSEEDLNAIVVKYSIKNVIVQVENLVFCYNIIRQLDRFGCQLFPVLHGSPYCWLKVYADLRQCLAKPIMILRHIKMAIYWRPKHLHIFRMLYKKWRILCVGEHSCKEMCSILKIQGSTNKVGYIYNPILLPTVNIDMNSKENKVIYVGRLSEEKSPLLMLKVWESVWKDYPMWTFDILGDGPLLKEMKDYISQKNIGNVALHGRVNNVFDYLKKSKISVLFSTHEGMPTSMVESGLCGNALLVAKGDGGAGDAVIDGCNGFMTSFSVEEITRLLRKMLKENGKEAVEMGKRSMDIVKKFNIDKIGESWRTLF